MEPITIGLLALTGFALRSKGRRRQIRRTARPGPRARQTIPRTPLTIAANCSSWDMPEEWIVQTAQPRFRRLLDDAMQANKGDLRAAKRRGYLDPVELTYAVLLGEIGSCPEPRLRSDDDHVLTFRELQSDIPPRVDYYPHAAILGLYDTIFEAVEAALSVLEMTGDPRRALLFPV